MTPRPRLMAALLLGLVFLAGSLTGMAVEEGLGLDWFDFLDEDEERVDADIFSHLDLSPEQARRINRILSEREDSLEAYWESRVPDLRRIVSEADGRIRGVLTPAQRTLFDSEVQARGSRIPDGPD